MSRSSALTPSSAHAETDRFVGYHILGARAGDLIAEAAAAIELGASAANLARSRHAHPTLSEVMREVALDVAHQAIHKGVIDGQYTRRTQVSDTARAARPEGERRRHLAATAIKRKTRG